MDKNGLKPSQYLCIFNLRTLFYLKTDQWNQNEVYFLDLLSIFLLWYANEDRGPSLFGVISHMHHIIKSSVAYTIKTAQTVSFPFALQKLPVCRLKLVVETFEHLS